MSSSSQRMHNTFRLRLLGLISGICLFCLTACGGGVQPAVAPGTIAQPSSQTVLAGTLGGAGTTDGPGGRFSSPNAVASDGAGNLYVADAGNNTIRKITPAGVVSTLAGTAGIAGAVDGVSPAASFYRLTGIAVGGSGNVYVSGNSRVRKITPDGVVTTLAGSATGYGSVDGPAASATFLATNGIAVDAAENIYVADEYKVRKISATGIVSTLAGGSDSSFMPTALAVDATGMVYVAQKYTATVLKITPAGLVMPLAGAAYATGSIDGAGAAARFNYPGGIAVDTAGTVYVADTQNNTIRKISPAGGVTTLAGSAAEGGYGSTDGIGAAARFLSPMGLTMDGAGNIYAADSGNNTIRKITLAGLVTTVAGTASGAGSADGNGTSARFNNAGYIDVGPSGSSYKANSGNNLTAGKFNYSGNVAMDGAGNVYVADNGNNTIRKITPAGVVSTLAGMTGVSGSADGVAVTATFNNPNGVAVDIAGNVYVADAGNHKIRKISAAGIVTTIAGGDWESAANSGFAGFSPGSVPVSIAVDASGNIFVADSGVGSIRKITASGLVSAFTAPGAGIFSVHGLIHTSALSAPSSLAIDAHGNIYATNTCSIVKITADGVIKVLAGAQHACGSSDGAGVAAGFQNPTGLALDAAGNIYVADSGNHTIRKVTPEGVVTTIAGRAGASGVVLGKLPGTLNFPVGMAIDAKGVLYTTSENAVLKIQL